MDPGKGKDPTEVEVTPSVLFWACTLPSAFTAARVSEGFSCSCSTFCRLLRIWHHRQDFISTWIIELFPKDKKLVMSIWREQKLWINGLSIYLSICLSVCLSVWLSICLSICLSIYLSISLFRSTAARSYRYWQILTGHWYSIHKYEAFDKVSQLPIPPDIYKLIQVPTSHLPSSCGVLLKLQVKHRTCEHRSNTYIGDSRTVTLNRVYRCL